MTVTVTMSPAGADDGLPELRSALREKLLRENGLRNSEVMVTAGCNQAFANVVLVTRSGAPSLFLRTRRQRDLTFFLRLCWTLGTRLCSSDLTTSTT